MGVYEVQERLRCPREKASLRRVGDALHCSACGSLYPVVDGVPVLIDETNSVFDVADYVSGQFYNAVNEIHQKLEAAHGPKRLYWRMITPLQWAHLPNRHLDAAKAVARMAQQIPAPEVLVVGAGLRRCDLPNITYTDVALHPDLACVCDAHDLPFADTSFDGVVASAVLEHVMDPIRCVAEIVRVLRPGGMVYAVTPFMQPVHMGRHDFTRWSHLGHRRLFRYFDDVESGICGGPGSAAALSLRALLMSMSDRPSLRRYLRLAGLLLAYPAMQVDRLALRTQSAYDGACAVYFFGKKRDAPVSDREILQMFRGA